MGRKRVGSNRVCPLGRGVRVRLPGRDALVRRLRGGIDVDSIVMCYECDKSEAIYWLSIHPITDIGREVGPLAICSDCLALLLLLDM